MRLGEVRSGRKIKANKSRLKPCDISFKADHEFKVRFSNSILGISF